MNKQSIQNNIEKGFNIILVFSLILVFYSFFIGMFYDTSAMQEELFYMDIGITIVFIIDLTILYKRSNSFSEFIRKNWIDIIATIPFVLILRFGKLLKLSRILRVFTRAAKSTKVVQVSKVAKLSKELKMKTGVLRSGKAISKYEKYKKTGAVDDK